MNQGVRVNVGMSADSNGKPVLNRAIAYAKATNTGMQRGAKSHHGRRAFAFSPLRRNPRKPEGPLVKSICRQAAKEGPKLASFMSASLGAFSGPRKAAIPHNPHEKTNETIKNSICLFTFFRIPCQNHSINEIGI